MSNTYPIVIGFGSESGNARDLAQALYNHPDLQAFSPRLLPLNEVTADFLTGNEPLIIITSSFGDGEPPSNAEAFLNALNEAGPLPHLRYAVFGLGDTGYPTFCGFSKQVDRLLAERKATPIMNRVDADSNFRNFFEKWVPVLVKALHGDEEAAKALTLQVRAYGEHDAFPAPVLERKRLNTSEPAAWHVRLSVKGSGMHWRAGDTLNVLPENDPALLQAIADWYGDADAITLLRHRELRLVSKGVLRELGKFNDNEALKDLLKFKNRKELEDYLWHADVLDVLQDFCSPQQVPLTELAKLLSPVLIRSYSIASPDNGEHLDLCLREVRYEHKGRLHRGSATRWLTSTDTPVRVYCRSNPGFHLIPDSQAPLILIGTGTGIAPLMGLLREMQARGEKRETCLIFGEKQREHDFLYQSELEALQQEGTLGSLHPAFSRDGEQKYYVQHAIADQAASLRDMLARGAHVYLCGNKAHLEGVVSSAIDQIMTDTPEAPADGSSYWKQLARSARLHLELY
ncbi:MAG: sulfite reductase flavoprotein subunit alpha [Lautropia sp.]|nr:sulfite reductase flavoprotein subunit alpha [Lautropia sp.]